MGWEIRDGHKYFYRKQRVGDKVKSIYLGNGRRAVEAARGDEIKRVGRGLSSRLESEQQDIDRRIDEHDRHVRWLATVALQLAGFHQHKGTWRLRRSRMEVTDTTTLAAFERWKELYAAAVDTDEDSSEVNELAEFTAANLGVFKHIRTLPDTIMRDLIRDANATEVMRIKVYGEMMALWHRMHTGNDSPLENMLIDSIVMNWLRLQLAEYAYSNESNSYAPARAEFFERRLSTTHRRFLQSVESLARVRRLMARAPVQINVAQQQIVQNN